MRFARKSKLLSYDETNENITLFDETFTMQSGVAADHGIIMLLICLTASLYLYFKSSISSNKSR